MYIADLKQLDFLQHLALVFDMVIYSCALRIRDAVYSFHSIRGDKFVTSLTGIWLCA